MVAFIASLIVTGLMVAVVMAVAKRRPPGTPVTWGEAFVGATFVFGLLFMLYGVVPHQWIDHADKNLGWSKDNIIYGPGGILKPQSAGGWNPITLQYEAVRDIVVVLIHVIWFGLLLWVWMWWQRRGETTSTEIETSSYGRPLVRKS